MKETTLVTKKIEFNKLEVQLKLFSEQMTYEQERYMRMYE
jgi:hypothetical protein